INLMKEYKVSIQKVSFKLTRYKHLSLSPLYIAVDGKLCGLLFVREILKPQAKETIKRLRALGIKHFLLLTRDSQEAADIAANQLGITESHGGLNSQQKAEIIQKLQSEGHTVAMIGDGVDDALAMAQANVGIALGGKGRNSGALVAGIVISSQDPLLAAEAIRLSQNTRELVHQNLNLSLGLNVIGLGLGAAGLVTPIGAGILNNLGVFSVLANSALFTQP
nr:HAD-IC family P-type ATPase [Desulfitobacterium hafniense]